MENGITADEFNASFNFIKELEKYEKLKEIEPNNFSHQLTINSLKSINIKLENIMNITEKVNELIDLHYRCENPIASQLDESVYVNEKIIAIEHSLITVSIFLDFMNNPFSVQYGFWLNVKKELNNELDKFKNK